MAIGLPPNNNTEAELGVKGRMQDNLLLYEIWSWYESKSNGENYK